MVSDTGLAKVLLGLATVLKCDLL